MKATLLTPPGAAAIAVVRLQGRAVAGFLARHFTGRPRVGRSSHGELRDGGRVIDDPVVALPDDQSADVNLHGGPWVVRSALDLFERSGFAVDSAAVSSLSSLTDETEPLWQEVLSALPRAKTELAVRLLLSQPAAWQRFMADGIGRDEAERMLRDRTIDRMLNTPTVAIVGPANVGKSTLANQLFGRERSITADIPGTTRDWVGELANLGGVAVMLVDTPGLRRTNDTIERSAIAQSRGVVEAADAVVLLLDGARPLDDEQRAALAEHQSAIVAVNKSDRPAAWNVAATLGPTAIQLAARFGQGIDRLTRGILNRLGCDDLAIDRARCWTNRQRSVVSQLPAMGE